MVSDLRARRWPIGTIAIIGLYCALALWIAREQATGGNINHLDGAYQTWTALRRMAGGQFPGKDFDVYLGIGPNVVLFPLFKMLGATVFASVASSWFWTLVTLLLLYRSFVDGVFARNPLPSAAGWGLAGVLALVSAVLLAKAPLLIFFTEPGNSLLSLRACIAVIAALAQFRYLSRPTPAPYARVAVILVAPLCLMWSNDYGAPTLLGHFAALGLAFVLMPERRRELAITTGMALAGCIVVVLAYLGPLAPQRAFNMAVAKDQYWYFGPYTPDYRYIWIGDALRRFARTEFFRFQVLSGPLLAVGLLFVKPRGVYIPLAVFAGVALMGGFLSEFFGHLDTRYLALYFIAWRALVCAWLVLGLSYVWSNFRRAPPRWNGGTLTAALMMLCLGLSEVVHLHLTRLSYGKLTYIPELGQQIWPTDTGDVDVARQMKAAYARGELQGSHLSTYRNMIDAVLERSATLPVDSLIHARGPALMAQEAQALKPGSSVSTVATTLPAWSSWAGWNVFMNWPFFRELVLNFDPWLEGRTLKVWRRSQERGPAGPVKACNWTWDGETLKVAVDPGTTAGSLVEAKVQIAYTKRPVRFGLARYFPVRLGPGGSNGLALSPYDNTLTFPVYAEGVTPVQIRWLAPGDVALKVQGCTTQVITSDANRIAALIPPSDASFFEVAQRRQPKPGEEPRKLLWGFW